MYLWSEIERGLDVFVLCPWRPPGVIKLETLVAEIGSAVGTPLSGFQSLRRLAKLAHHSDTAQAHCVSVPGESVKRQGGKKRHNCSTCVHLVYFTEILRSFHH